MKKIIAFIVDFLISFIGMGYLIASITGETTDGGFNLEGGSAFLLIILVILYFVLTKRFFGATPGRKLLKIEEK